MQAQDSRRQAANCRQAHVFSEGNPLAERRTRWVLGLTLVVMVAEIAGGWLFNSMALLADGWHMSSHALALGLAVFAYWAARYFAQDRRFAFGTWKIEILGGYTSALMLVGVAALMLFQSIDRLIAPLPIGYDQAIGTAFLGLGVNLLSAFLLHEGGHGHGHGHHHHGHTHHHADHDHDHDHEHEHEHEHAHADEQRHQHGHEHPPGQALSQGQGEASEKRHADLNLRAAYLHVLADAATSVLAIVALFGGKYWGADWLDPLMGVAGAVLVAIWAKGLLLDCARVLLDAEMDDPLVGRIRRKIEQGVGAATLTDLHLWRVSHQKYACIIALSGRSDPVRDGAQDVAAHSGAECPAPRAGEARKLSPELVHQLLRDEPRLVHLTVEVNMPARTA